MNGPLQSVWGGSQRAGRSLFVSKPVFSILFALDCTHFDVLSKTCNPEQIFANFASQKFCENGGEENELKKWLKSAKNWTRFVKFLKKRPKKALFLLGDKKYDINLEFYPDFALNWAILHIYFPLCLYFVQFRQRNFGTQKPFSAKENRSILCFATFLAKSILYFIAQVIFS